MTQLVSQSQDKVLVKVPSAAIHTLYSSRKRLRHFGELEIIESNDSSLWLLINHNTKHQILEGTIFYKLVKDKYTSYLFDAIKGGFVTITIEGDLPQLDGFEDALDKKGSIIDFNKGLETNFFKKKVEYHCPKILTQSIHVENIFTPLHRWTGAVENFVFSKFDKTHKQIKKSDQKTETLQSNQINSKIQEAKQLIKNSWIGFTTQLNSLNTYVQKINPLKTQNKEQQKPEIVGNQKNVTNTEEKKNENKVSKLPEKVQKKISEKIQKVQKKIEEKVQKKIEEKVAPKIEQKQEKIQVKQQVKVDEVTGQKNDTVAQQIQIQPLQVTEPQVLKQQNQSTPQLQNKVQVQEASKQVSVAETEQTVQKQEQHVQEQQANDQQPAEGQGKKKKKKKNKNN